MRVPLERRLPAANGRIRDDVPSQFDPRVMSIGLRFHNRAPDYAPGGKRLQAAEDRSQATEC